MIKKNIHIVILFLMGQALLAQEASFTSSVSKDRLGVNERLRIVFSFNRQGGDNFTPPDFKDFQVLAGPMQSTSFMNNNGKQSFEQSYSYVIQPRRKGKITIPSGTIEYNGKILKSSPINITVLDAVEVPVNPNDPAFIVSQNAHLVAEISDTNPYVSEAIMITYKLFFDTDKIGPTNYRVSEFPDFDGFVKQEITKDWKTEKGTFQGRSYSYRIIAQALLIPQKTGKLVISPADVVFDADVPTNRRGLFGNMYFDHTSVNLSTGQRTVEVKPLPVQNKPDDFSGAVGDFDFSVTADKTELKANEPSQIKIEVSGKGNLKFVELPKINTPQGLEKYEPEHKDQLATTPNGYEGTVYDQYTVVPQYRGKFKIPPVSFSYFSLKDKKYKTLTSEAIIINAPEGRTPSEAENANTVVQHDVVSNAQDIRYIATKAALEPAVIRRNFLGSDLFYSLLALPLLAIPLGIFIGFKKRQRASDIVGNKRREADRLAKKYLSEAKKQLGNQEGFYVALERALHNYLKAKLHVETTDISKDKIREMLLNRKVDSETIDGFIKVFDDCEYARYTPVIAVMIQDEYKNAREAISKIDKQL
ncbi:MAG: protein BatD [Flavobacteriaceae bacterium]|nr:protein BatD [Flavobacteriaceae bacterium]